MRRTVSTQRHERRNTPCIAGRRLRLRRETHPPPQKSPRAGTTRCDTPCSTLHYRPKGTNSPNRTCRSRAPTGTSTAPCHRPKGTNSPEQANGRRRLRLAAPKTEHADRLRPTDRWGSPLPITAAPRNESPRQRQRTTHQRLAVELRTQAKSSTVLGPNVTPPAPPHTQDTARRRSRYRYSSSNPSGRENSTSRRSMSSATIISSTAGT